MKINRIWNLVLLALGVTLLAPVAMAQCESNVPQELNLYQSYCIQVCPWEEYVFFLWCPYPGAENFPHVIMTPGCTSGGPDCNLDCTPIQPPAWPWRPGQPPSFGADPHQPDAIFVENECMQIYVYWNHDGYWVMEILMNNCAGCFCLWFDWQLPVELDNFDAIGSDSEVTLNWSTLSETNNDRFEIVRDGDGVVATIPSQGTATAGYNYHWVDENVQNGTTYTYRLRIVDMTGLSEEVRVASATPGNSDAGLVTEYALYQNYPNPFNPTTTIAFDVPQSGNVSLTVYNPVGQQVATLVNGPISSGRHSVNFDASRLTSGLYFYTIRSGDFTATRKMLLVK